MAATALQVRDDIQEAARFPGHARRRQRALAAQREVLIDRFGIERDGVGKLRIRLNSLQQMLKKRLLADDGSVTDFQRFNLQALTGDVDRMIADTASNIADDQKTAAAAMVRLGQDMADQPLAAAQVQVTSSLPGLDAALVTAAFDNTADLLTQPMQQFGTDVKVALRRVSLAGDNKFQAIADLRDKIAGQGMNNALYKAERIIRTELGRTFNEATYGRLLGLAQEFPFLRKGWRATGDNRTRQGHIEAGRTYSRGAGSIHIAELFEIRVYDERPGKPRTLIGICRLRFPVDPQAQPAGRVAAGATIMCRCNAFVDFDLADFASFTAAKIQLATGGILPPVAPGPKPVQPALQVPVRARKPPTRKPKAAPIPAVATKAQPGGTKVSDAVDFRIVPRFRKDAVLTAEQRAKVKRAYDVLDSVHGDGNLPKIPVVGLTRRKAIKGTLAFYARSMATERPVELGFGAKALRSHPNMATWHETGHFIDHVGFDGDHMTFSSQEDQGLMAGWLAAVKNSKAIQTMAAWRAGDGAPAGVNPKMLDYMLSSKETWARSYAQYIAVKSKDPGGLKELRNMQAAAANSQGAVPADRRYNRTLQGMRPVPGTWDYHWAWSDDDFKPIEAAIDSLMEKMGWRTTTAK